MLECSLRGETAKFGRGVFGGESCALGAIDGEPHLNFRCGQRACSEIGSVGAEPYFEENLLKFLPPAQVDGLYGCLDYYQTVTDPFSVELLNKYNKLYPGGSMFTAGSASTGTYRGLKFWEAAVKEAGSLNQEAVIKALDHAKIAAGPGGPAELVPGQHHARLNMYIAQASNGIFKVVKNLGVVEPNESAVIARHAASR